MQATKKRQTKIPLDKTEIHDHKDFVAKFYVKKEDGQPFNALLVECNTRHHKTKLIKATRMYFVISGNGSFTINGRKEEANPNDLFTIESGDVYEYSGKMRLIEVNVPPTDRSNEEKLE